MLSPSPLIKLIFSCLKDRNFHVKFKDSISQQFFAHFDVPQEDKLSPKLFKLLFTNNMPHHLHTPLAIFSYDT